MVTPLAVQKLVDKLRTQRHITIEHKTIPGANHFFVNEMDQLMKASTTISTSASIRAARSAEPRIPKRWSAQTASRSARCR